MSGDRLALASVAALAFASLARSGSRAIPGPYARPGALNLDTACCATCGCPARGSRAGTPEDRLRPAMRTRRLTTIYSIGQPYDEATQHFALFGVDGAPALLDQMGPPRLSMRAGSARQPALVLERPVFAKGRALGRAGQGQQAVSLFTATKKMNAPSFSLPAGPTDAGGTCLAAKLIKGRGIVSEEGTFVCSTCYALKGNYPQHGPVFAQAVRLRWVTALLEQDPSGRTLAAQLVQAVDETARHTDLQSPRLRALLELGVWRDGRIMAPHSRGRPAILTQSSSLPAPWGSTTAVIESLNPRNGDVAGYFRLHDSGDVNVGPNLKSWVAYLEAWARVARTFPAVIFWLPTRSWFVPGMGEAIARVAAATPNLVIRPSGFTTCSPPPVVQGAAAGTAVVEVKPGKSPDLTDKLGREAWACPVYVSDADSCLAANCRMCWVGKDVPVWYRLH